MKKAIVLMGAGVVLGLGAGVRELKVNPFIGAITESDAALYDIHGMGKTFPGAATPLGMVQLSPDTVTGGDNGPGYSRLHKTIEGFSFMHLSGIGWYGEFGNFQVMPTTGEFLPDREKAKSAFRKESERAEAGYYAVELERYGIKVELTAAPRSGIMRIGYPKGAGVRRVQIDLGRRIGQKERWLKHSRQTVRQVSPTAIEGEIWCPCEDGGWGRGGGKVSYTVYYRCEFSEEGKAGVWEKDGGMGGAENAEGKNLTYWAEFPAGEKPLLVKAGFSYVSAEGARANLAKDIPGFDFAGTRREAARMWGEAARNIWAEGGTEEQREIFDTALYHALIDPRAISDYDGRYRNAKGEVKQSGEFVQRTVFSGWDVFRSEFPLLTLIRPDVVNDTINSMSEVMKCGARNSLPVWDIFGCESSCMVGNPMMPVIVDAWEKGIRGFDGEEALDLMIRTAKVRGNDRKLGYVPGQISMTLEYAYNDWCIGRMAEMLGKAEVAKEYYGYAQCYTNLWSAEAGWMRGRKRDGGWMEWKGKKVHGQGCVESNPYQQGWFVPHDMEGLARLMGGREAMVAELERFMGGAPAKFTWNDYYNHPNEPVHHVPFMFSALGRMDLTAKWTEKICRGAYGNTETGLCGNDDVGQMSAWYVLAAIGLHPVCPGDGKWMLTRPLFAKTTIRLDPKYYRGGTFTILAKGAEREGAEIVEVRLNGKRLGRAYVTTKEVGEGGVLEFVLGGGGR